MNEKVSKEIVNRFEQIKEEFRMNFNEKIKSSDFWKSRNYRLALAEHVMKDFVNIENKKLMLEVYDAVKEAVYVVDTCLKK